MRTKSPQAQDRKEPRRGHQSGRQEPWRNTKPRGNPETDVRDLNRSIERFEMLLGR
jgi:hypothetical protein